MLKRLSLVTGAVAVALVATALVASSVFAGGPGPKAAGSEIGGQDIPLAVAADLLGWTEEEVVAALEHDQTTIPVLLEENGIDLSTFHQAVADARQAALDEAVESGAITTQQAGTMLKNGTCDGTGPGPMAGNSYGGPGDGTGSGPFRHGNSYGESSDGAGPGLENKWGAAWQ